MKGTVSILIELAKDLAKNNPQTDFALMITSDEEEEGYSCDWAIVPDGGSNFHLMLAEKGVLHIKIEAKGKTAHGSRPWLGENALDKLTRLYLRIRKRMPGISPKDNWKPTLNLGIMSGGDATNKVCDSAFIQLDFRYLKKEQRKELLNMVKEEAEKEKGVKVKILVRGPPLMNNPKNKYLQGLKEIARKYGRQLKTEEEHGASGGRFFSEKGTPVIMVRPFCSDSHIDNEWIDLKSPDEYYQILKDFILSFG